MIEIFGNYLPWTPELLKENITDRLLNGDDLTICCKDKKAWINKWLKDPLEINYELAHVIVSLGLVGCDSGNIETGERHYNFKSR